MTINDIGIFVLGLLTGLVLRWQLTPSQDGEGETQSPTVVINNNYYHAATLETSSPDDQNPDWPDGLNTGGGTE